MTNEIERVLKTYTRQQLISYLVDTTGCSPSDYKQQGQVWTTRAIVEDIEYQEGNFAALDSYLM